MSRPGSSCWHSAPGRGRPARDLRGSGLGPCPRCCPRCAGHRSSGSPLQQGRERNDRGARRRVPRGSHDNRSERCPGPIGGTLRHIAPRRPARHCSGVRGACCGRDPCPRSAASMLGAGYAGPLITVVFVAEYTGQAALIVPGLLGLRPCMHTCRPISSCCGSRPRVRDLGQLPGTNGGQTRRTSEPLHPGLAWNG